MTNHSNIISSFKDEAKELIECGNSTEKSYGRGMLEVLRRYEQLLDEFKQYKKESIKWSVEDFIEYDHPTHKIDRETAQTALEDMISHHDASYGISWASVEYGIELYGIKK
jgi:hypothetical protein